MITDDDVDQLRLLIMRQRRAARNDEYDVFLELDEQFHLKIVDAAKLPILYGVLGQLRGFVRLARLDANRVGAENSVRPCAGRGWHDRGMIASVIYWTLRRLVELLVLRRRSDDGKAVEILVAMS